jgi:hypothetical protein
MNFMLAHKFDPTRTIADVYEMPMKFQSEFCKIYFKKVSNIMPATNQWLGLQLPGKMSGMRAVFSLMKRKISIDNVSADLSRTPPIYRPSVVFTISFLFCSFP